MESITLKLLQITLSVLAQAKTVNSRMVWVQKGAANSSVIDFIVENGMEDRVVLDQIGHEFPKVTVHLDVPKASSLPHPQRSTSNATPDVRSVHADGGPCGAISMLNSIINSVHDVSRPDAQSTETAAS